MPGVRLGFEEREKIALGIARDEPLCDIASRLGRPTSTVSREVKRCGGRDNYTASRANRDSRTRAKRPKCRKLLTNAELANYVSEALTKRWSPAEVSAKLRREYPDNQEMRVSPETIYCSLYLQGKGGLKKELISKFKFMALAKLRMLRNRLERTWIRTVKRIKDLVSLIQ